MVGPERRSSHEALQAWLGLFEAELDDAGITVVRDHCLSLSGPEGQAPPAAEPQHAQANAPMPAPPPLVNGGPAQPLPTWETLLQIAQSSIPTQRHIPRVMVTAVQELVQDLLNRSDLSSDHTPLSGPLPAHLLLVLPKLVWPQIANAEGMRNAALVRHRLAMAHAGQWRDLCQQALETDQRAHRQAAAHAAPPTHAATGAADPQLRTVLNWARRGRPMQGIKMALSRGVHEPTDEVLTRIHELLAPHRHPATMPSEPAQGNLPPLAWARTVRSLKAQRAFDPLGWSAEAFQQLFRAPLLQVPLERWLTHLALHEQRAQALHMLHMVQAIPLRKNDDGVRPVLLITLFRKAIGMNLRTVLQTQCLDRLADRQFGLAQREGCSQMTLAVAQRMQEHPANLALQIDLANAFGRAHRAAVHEAMHELAGPYATMLLRHLTPANEVRVGGMALPTTISQGLIQGDPLSTLAFCALLDQAWRPLIAKAQQHNVRFHAYVDDAVLVGPPMAVEALFADFQTNLAKAGLQVKQSKCRIWAPEAPPPEAAQLTHIWAQSTRHDGLHLLGQQATTWDDEDWPVGGPAFVKDALADLLVKLQSRYDLFASLLAQSSHTDPVGQIVLYLLQHYARSTLTHVFRAVPFAASHLVATAVQQAQFQLLTRVLQAPLGEGMQAQATLPVLQGGLGLPNLNKLALCARIAALRNMPWHGAAGQALQRFAAQELEILQQAWVEAGGSRYTLDSLAFTQPHPKPVASLQRKLLHLLTHFEYERLRSTEAQRVHMGATIGAVAETIRQHEAVRLHDGRFQAGVGAWIGMLPVTANRTLTNRQVTLGLRMRLSIPVFGPNQRCANTKATPDADGSLVHRACGALHGPDAGHCLVCAKTLHTRRHNALRDLLAQHARNSAIYCHIEQLTVNGVAQPEQADESQVSVPDAGAPARPRRPIARADLHFLDLAGGDLYADTRITAVPALADPLGHLRQQDRSKPVNMNTRRPCLSYSHATGNTAHGLRRSSKSSCNGACVTRAHLRTTTGHPTELHVRKLTSSNQSQQCYCATA